MRLDDITAISPIQDPVRLSALHAILRDNTGRTRILEKSQAFHALPAKPQALDIKV